MEVSNSLLRKEGILRGIPLGLLSILFSVISYYTIISGKISLLKITVAPVIFSVILPIAAASYFAWSFRKSIGGYWNLRQATTGLFIMLVVSYLITNLGFNVLFTKLIAPLSVEKMQSVVTNATVNYLEKTGAGQAKIDEQLKTLDEQFDAQKNISPGKVISSFAVSLIMLFVFAIALAAVFKKEQLVRYSAEDTVDPTA